MKGTWSKTVPSQEAAGVGEGWGTGAGWLATQGDMAVALVVAVVYRAGVVLAEVRVLQGCRGGSVVSSTIPTL